MPGGRNEGAPLPLARQYEEGRARLEKKWGRPPTIAYFQNYTSTYAPLSVLKPLYEEALSFEGVVGLTLGTRPDCLQEDLLCYLESLCGRTHLTVELGLQSAHDRTATLINRGHTWETFCRGYASLRAASERIQICVHLIFGLPGEDEEDMLETVRRVAALRPDQVKIHLLHVIRGTVLADMYERGDYVPMARDRYIEVVARALTLLPPQTVIGRLTGDGMGSDLLAIGAAAR